jgi:hypothetical protein
MALTRAERKLQAEIQDIAVLIEMDFWAIGQRYKRGYRRNQLELMKDKLVRGEVVYLYTRTDELLKDVMLRLLFP